MNTTIEHVVINMMAKYGRLEEEMQYVYRNSSADHINIFFDMYAINKVIYSSNMEVVFTDAVDLAASIINLCIHYRTFFRRFGVETTIYIVSGLNCPDENIRLVPEYNSAMVNRRDRVNNILNEHIEKNITLLNILCPYLPDIHFIHTKYETSVVISSLIKKYTTPKESNLIITRDLYPFQLLTMYPNLALLRPKKGIKGEDLSYIIKNPENTMEREVFWKYFYKERESKTYSYLLSPKNISLISALCSYPHRCLNTMISISYATKLILQIVGEMDVACTPASFCDMHENYLSKRNISRDLIFNRFHALDIPFQEETIYNISQEFQTLSFDNKIDPYALNSINNKYFRNMPIDLDRL